MNAVTMTRSCRPRPWPPVRPPASGAGSGPPSPSVCRASLNPVAGPTPASSPSLTFPLGRQRHHGAGGVAALHGRRQGLILIAPPEPPFAPKTYAPFRQNLRPRRRGPTPTDDGRRGREAITDKTTRWRATSWNARSTPFWRMFLPAEGAMVDPIDSTTATWPEDSPVILRAEGGAAVRPGDRGRNMQKAQRFRRYWMPVVITLVLPGRAGRSRRGRPPTAAGGRWPVPAPSRPFSGWAPSPSTARMFLRREPVTVLPAPRAHGFVGSGASRSERRRHPLSTAGGPPPPALSPLVGRDDEVRRLVKLLASTRLVTLTRAPGVGKSHLAPAAASRPSTA